MGIYNSCGKSVLSEINISSRDINSLAKDPQVPGTSDTLASVRVSVVKTGLFSGRGGVMVPPALQTIR
jgi:hypothetical protein